MDGLADPYLLSQQQQNNAIADSKAVVTTPLAPQLSSRCSMDGLTVSSPSETLSNSEELRILLTGELCRSQLTALSHKSSSIMTTTGDITVLDGSSHGFLDTQRSGMQEPSSPLAPPSQPQQTTTSCGKNAAAAAAGGRNFSSCSTFSQHEVPLLSSSLQHHRSSLRSSVTGESEFHPCGPPLMSGSHPARHRVNSFDAWKHPMGNSSAEQSAHSARATTTARYSPSGKCPQQHHQQHHQHPHESMEDERSRTTTPSTVRYDSYYNLYHAVNTNSNSNHSVHEKRNCISAMTDSPRGSSGHDTFSEKTHIPRDTHYFPRKDMSQLLSFVRDESNYDSPSRPGGAGTRLCASPHTATSDKSDHSTYVLLRPAASSSMISHHHQRQSSSLMMATGGAGTSSGNASLTTMGEVISASPSRLPKTTVEDPQKYFQSQQRTSLSCYLRRQRQAALGGDDARGSPRHSLVTTSSHTGSFPFSRRRKPSAELGPLGDVLQECKFLSVDDVVAAVTESVHDISNGNRTERHTTTPAMAAVAGEASRTPGKQLPHGADAGTAPMLGIERHGMTPSHACTLAAAMVDMALAREGTSSAAAGAPLLPPPPLPLPTVPSRQSPIDAPAVLVEEASEVCLPVMPVMDYAETGCSASASCLPSTSSAYDPLEHKVCGLFKDGEDDEVTITNTSELTAMVDVDEDEGGEPTILVQVDCGDASTMMRCVPLTDELYHVARLQLWAAEIHAVPPVTETEVTT